ncbi:hypothetical protein BZA77DRAFT_318793 [Pyronema omphalodes]|nr:hypothetical protein BZA77DRAFT_318793 [Pyronema omphalodes]
MVRPTFVLIPLLSSIPLILSAPTSSAPSGSVPPPLTQIPRPTGPERYIGTTSITLTDRSRPEEFGTGNRRVVVQAYYPISQPQYGSEIESYLSPLIGDLLGAHYGLPNGTLNDIRTNSYYEKHPGPKFRGMYPIIFSTGMGVPRHIYTTMYEDLASYGYCVFSIDHPYDAAAVEFSDGTVAYSRVPMNLTDEVTEKFFQIRIKDIRFVADQLENFRRSRLMRLDKIGAFGHSLGGAAVAGAMIGRTRIKAGMNMDGGIWGEVGKSDVSGNFLLMGTPDHNSTVDPTWKSWRNAQDGWNREMTIKGAKHGLFSDYPTLVDMLGFRKVPGIEELIGTMKGDRARKLLGAYTRDFFGWSLKKNKLKLINKKNAQYPEVEYIERLGGKSEVDTQYAEADQVESEYTKSNEEANFGGVIWKFRG